MLWILISIARAACVLEQDCSEPYGACKINNGQVGVKCDYPTVSIGKSCGGQVSGKCQYPYYEPPRQYVDLDEKYNTTFCAGGLVCYSDPDDTDHSLDIAFAVFLIVLGVVVFCCGMYGICCSR